MALQRGEVALRVERRHAARAGSGDRLPVGVILHVAGREDARDVRLGRARLRDEVAAASWSSWSTKSDVFGSWPIATKTPSAGTSRVSSVSVLRRRSASTLTSPTTSSTTTRARSRSSGSARARLTMICEARNSSRRWTRCTFVANCVRKSASSKAESPPPTTTTSFSGRRRRRRSRRRRRRGPAAAARTRGRASARSRPVATITGLGGVRRRRRPRPGRAARRSRPRSRRR